MTSKKSKKAVGYLMAVAMMVMMPVTAFATGWQKNNTGWWYGTNADNSAWYANGWQWIDGNKDGISECYYFAPNGYIVTNGKTPDGYDVNADGQWTINGVVQTIGAVATQATGTTNTNRPSSKEIIDYLYRGRTDSEYFGTIDTSRPEWNNGVTNIYMKDAVGSRWSKTHGGWYYLGYDNLDVEAIAINDEGYLLADTMTPDGYYVNKRGVLEIDGREVTHNEQCLYLASSVNAPDPNHVDPNKYKYWEVGIGHSWRMSSMPYGKLIYNHIHSFDHEQGGIGSRIDSYNDFGVCALYDAENSYKYTTKK